MPPRLPSPFRYRSKAYAEAEDALGRRMCYRDGIHVPCPGEAGAPEDFPPPQEPRDYEQEAFDEVASRPTQDIQLALNRLGRESRGPRRELIARLAALLLDGTVSAYVARDRARPPEPPEREPPEPKGPLELRQRLSRLHGKPLPRGEEDRYRAVLSSLPLPELLSIRDDLDPAGTPEAVGNLPDGEVHEYGCLMAVVPPGLAREAVRWARTAIRRDDLGTDGVESEPHITVLYGFDSETDPNALRMVLKDVRPFRVSLGRLTHFDGDADDTPLIVEAESQTLRKLNAMLQGRFDVAEKYPEYRPHLTVAYVREDAVSGYEKARRLPFTDTSVTVDTLVYSAPDGTRTTYRLRQSVGDLPPSPLTMRKTLGKYGEKGVQRNGRVARARMKQAVGMIRKRREEADRLRATHPDYRHVEGTTYAADDIHEESGHHGGIRSEHVEAAKDRTEERAARERHVRSRSYRRSGGNAGRGMREENIRDDVNEPNRSTRQNRKRRYADQNKTPEFRRNPLYSAPKQKSLVRPSPFRQAACGCQNSLQCECGGVT